MSDWGDDRVVTLEEAALYVEAAGGMNSDAFATGLRELKGRIPSPEDEQTDAEKLEELEAIFDMRWDADMRAIKRWQAAGPDRDLTWPDHADLVVWLLERLEEAEAKVGQ